MRALLAISALLVWGLALAYWPDLPNEIPMHFGLSGEPDRFAQKSIVSWFWMPTLALVFAYGLGILLPKWVRAMAVSNSAFLNIPDQKRFRALSTEGRVRVVDATMRPMMWLTIVLQLLFAWVVFSSAQVALGHWQKLPLWPTFSAIFMVMVCAVLLVTVSNKAVASEVARHEGTAQ